MRKPEGFDGAETREGGFREPPAGPHILGINKAVSEPSRHGNQQLVIYLDIAEGAFKNHYREKGLKFNGNFYLRHYQGTEGKSLPYFKGLITAIEESNPGYKFDFNEATLSRKLIGGNLREEEYPRRDGTLGTRLRPAYLCSVDSIRKGGHKVLPLKKLPKTEDEPDFAPPPADDFDQSPPPQDDLPF